MRHHIEAMVREGILNYNENGTFHKRCILPSEFYDGMFFWVWMWFFLFLFSIPNLIKTCLKTEMQAHCSSKFQVKWHINRFFQLCLKEDYSRKCLCIPVTNCYFSYKIRPPKSQRESQAELNILGFGIALPCSSYQREVPFKELKYFCSWSIFASYFSCAAFLYLKDSFCHYWQFLSFCSWTEVATSVLNYFKKMLNSALLSPHC